MQILIMFYSRTGHTKKLAKEIANGVLKVADVKCELKEATKVTREDFIKSDALIVGSPVYFGSMASEVKNVFDRFVDIRKQMENKVGAAFATSADLSGGKETTIMSIIQAMLIYGMIIVGDPIKATGHYGVSCTGIPDKVTCLNAAKMGKRVAILAKKLQ